jgi:hypothetical protein
VESAFRVFMKKRRSYIFTNKKHDLKGIMAVVLGAISLISLVIVLGQILIVTFAGRMFNVLPLQSVDWLWIMAITAPVLVVADIFRTLYYVIKK